MRNIVIYLLLMFFYISTINIYCQSNKKIDRFIATDNIDSLKYYSEETKSYRDQNGNSLMLIAIATDNYKLFNWLLNNNIAVNTLCNNYTPLMLAAKQNKLKFIKRLLKHGVSVNTVNILNNNALFYAVSFSDLEIIELLLEAGIDPTQVNRSKRTVDIIAIERGDKELAKFLRDQMIAYRINRLPGFVDGPHVKLYDDKLKIEFFVSDSGKRSIKHIKRSIPVKGGDSTILAKTKVPNIITPQINTKRYSYKSIFPESDSIVVVGDVHGEFEVMVELLKGNNVIDSNLNWIYGKGHLVFIGDIFDRGDEVTNSLWLIYNLEQQARRSGGVVHLILGNHELMVLKEDKRYFADRYKAIERKLEINYSAMFSNDYLLGEWLRKKNCIERIGNFLFTHAGVSDSMRIKNISIEYANKLMHTFLNDDFNSYTEKDVDNLSFILTDNGLLWYRGMLMDYDGEPRMKQNTLEEVLEFYDSEYVIIGHTGVKKIVPLYKGKVFPIDVSFSRGTDVSHILVIENGFIYSGYADGKRNMLLEL
ncbi:MAG: ankyrin repeat domain-containing protein [Bacteroidales bacterium]|nr:ankyrin repeat domain-containing protein [Bacteroidales bacterium]